MNKEEIKELMTALSTSPDFLSTVHNFPGEEKSLMEIALFFYSMGYADCIEFNEEKRRVKKLGGFRAYQFKHKPTESESIDD